MEEVVKLVANESILLIITSVVLYFAYRYLNLKLDMFERQMKDSLKKKEYSVKGSVNYEMKEYLRITSVDLVISEVRSGNDD